jgi:proteasome lid subunit RPN8/RPN11
MRATYRGRIPDRTLAIIHTHPNARPNPSPDDIATAQKLGMPVYVVTRSMVTRTDGWRTTRVAQGDWNPGR